MEIQGIITAILPERSGVSARGEWKSQEFVITTQEQYPRMICFQVFGADRIAQFALQMGEVVNVGFDISAREYQGRYFNQLNAWKVERPASQAHTNVPPVGAPPTTPPPAPAQPAGYGQPTGYAAAPPSNGGYSAPPVGNPGNPPQSNGEGGLPF